MGNWQADQRAYIAVAVEELPEVILTTVKPLGWKDVFVNERLGEATASYRKIDKRGRDTWRYEFELVVNWRKQTNGTVEVTVTVTGAAQATNKLCYEQCYKILEGIKSRAERLKKSDHERKRSDTYGSAKWATDQDLVRAGYIGDGHDRFILGPSSNGGYFSVPGPETAMHAIVCGPTGSGKSSTVYIPNLIERTNTSAIVTEATAGDEQPDLFKKTAGFRQVSGQKIYKFNPADLTSHRINPLQHVRTFDQASQVANLIVQNSSNKISVGDQIWETSEKQLLTVLVLHAVGERGDLGLIRRLLREGPDGLAKIMANSQFVEARKEYEGFYNGTSDGFRKGVISGVMQRLNPWVNPKIVALTETTDIDLNALADERFTFYLAVPAHEDRFKPLAALIFNFILNISLEKKFRYPLTLFLDEFTNFGHIPGMAEKLTIIRHRNLPAVLGFQDYVQIEKVYGGHDAGLLFNQPGTKIFFRPRDLNVARKISEALGTKTVIDRKVTSTGQIIEKEMGRQLMNPGEVMALEAGKAIAFTPSTPPVLLKTFTWQQYAGATGREPPAFRKLQVNEELARKCEETKAKPQWQREWEEARANTKNRSMDN